MLKFHLIHNFQEILLNYLPNSKEKHYVMKRDLFPVGNLLSRVRIQLKQCKHCLVSNVLFIIWSERKWASSAYEWTNEWMSHMRTQPETQFHYTLSECIIVHMSREPLLNKDVRVSNHIITILSTELLSLFSISLSSYAYRQKYNRGMSVRVIRFIHAM